MLQQSSGLAGVWWLIAIMSLFGFVGSLFFKNGTIINGIVLLGGLAAIVNPFLGVWLTPHMIWVATQSKSEQYDVLCVTTLSDMKLVEGFFFFVLYRLRVPVVFMFALAPAVIVRLTDNVYNGYNSCALYRSDCQPPTSIAVFHWLLLNCTYLLVAVGVLMLGIALSMALSLWWQNRLAAAGFGTAVLTILLMGFFLLAPNGAFLDNDPATSLVRAIAYMVLIYVASFAVLLATQRVARRRT
jgi:hypothetical protein